MDKEIITAQIPKNSCLLPVPGLYRLELEYLVDICKRRKYKITILVASVQMFNNCNSFYQMCWVCKFGRVGTISMVSYHEPVILPVRVVEL